MNTKRTLAFTAIVVGAFVAGLVGFSVKGATPDVGAHLHVGITNEPTDGHPIAGPYTFHVVLKLHDQPLMTGYLRIDDSSTTRAQMPITLGPAADITYAFDWTVDFGKWSAGRHEVRWHLDAKSSTVRQYTTSRFALCVVTCSINAGGRFVAGGGSWYTGPGYVVPLLISPYTSVAAGGPIVARSEYSAGSKTCVFVNPDFHHGTSGTSLGCWTGTSNHTVSLAGTVVGDKLVIVSMGKQEAGVLRLIVGNGSDKPTADVETQSWWAVNGLVLP